MDVPSSPKGSALTAATAEACNGTPPKRASTSANADDAEAVGSAVLLEADGAAAVLHGRSSGDTSRLAWAKFLLVATGVWWGVCMQLLVYQGAGNPRAMLPNADWYIGMMLVYTTRLCANREHAGRYATIKQLHILPIAVCDYLGTIGTTVGLVLSGSALFGIIFSSVTVWTALFTCLLLHKSQTLLKMAGIVTVVIGLALPTLDQASDTTEGGDDIFAGIILTFMGTLFYALEYTLCERVFSLYDRPVDSRQLCFFTGAWGLLFTLIWMCVYTFPHWNEVVTEEVAAAEGSPWLILFLFATHTINNGVHNAAWFVVCELESGVSTGLLMGLKAAALFVFSALCFCKPQSPWPQLLDDHREQCMTRMKTFATCIVLVGTAVYYWPEKQTGALSSDGTRVAGLELEPASGTQPSTSKKPRFPRLDGGVPMAEFTALRDRVEHLEADNRILASAVRAIVADGHGKEADMPDLPQSCV
mmetsp:Transcript_5657/g.15007  ORF Transcript_5657/g.15007 Transcript_5657/m.15007 type:complete len:475 (-) Transcript_5657:483-1907(-)